MRPKLRDLHAIGDVGRYGKGPLTELSCQFLETLGTSGGQGDAVAVRDQRSGDGEADAAGGPGHDRDSIDSH
jgi:hypothetical protein